MSHKKILELAHKFAKKTVMFNHDQLMETQKLNAYFTDFQRNFRSLLNEMSGDHITLKIKGVDRTILKEFTILYHNLLEHFKKFNEQQPYESLQHIVNYVFSKSTKSSINFLHNNIQEFLKQNEVNFTPGKNFSQAQVKSLSNLIEIITSAHNFLLSNSQRDASSIERSKNEKEDYVPLANSMDKTKT